MRVLNFVQKCIHEHGEFNNWGWHNRHLSLLVLLLPQSQAYTLAPGQPYAFRQAGL